MKEVKTNKINVKKILRKVVRVLAFVAVFLLAGYGLRQMFAVMQDGLSVALTAGITAGLAYIIFGDA